MHRIVMMRAITRPSSWRYHLALLSMLAASQLANFLAPSGSASGVPDMSKPSIAIVNLRAFAILLVVSFHSTLAYLASQTASSLPFDSPPYDWRTIPILDSDRWFGFDLYGALQYVFLMPFM